MLRLLIKDEIECAGIDGMEHGAWGWAEKQLDEGWKKFQKSFNADEPSSLKKQALGALYAIATGADDTREFHQDIETIKTALEALDD